MKNFSLWILALVLLIGVAGCNTTPTDPATFPRFANLIVQFPTQPDEDHPVQLTCRIAPNAFVVRSMNVEYVKHACESPPPAGMGTTVRGGERPATSMMRGQCGPNRSDGPELYCLYQYDLTLPETHAPGDCLTFVCRANYRFSTRSDPEVKQSKPCTSNTNPAYDSTRCNFGR